MTNMLRIADLISTELKQLPRALCSCTFRMVPHFSDVTDLFTRKEESEGMNCHGTKHDQTLLTSSSTHHLS